MLETQCSSWSRARRGPPGSGWAAIRDNNHILGLPNLSEADENKVLLGNIHARNTASIIRICLRHHVPCMLENPLTSMLWKYPALLHLQDHSSFESHTLDQCQFGAPWRKATRIGAWLCRHCTGLDRRCSGSQGTCSRTGKPHIVLSGVSKTHKVLWTSLAQVYPAKLCQTLASVLTQSSLDSRHYMSARLRCT